MASRASFRARRALQTQSPTSLFPAPTNIIKPWKAVTGAQEWQTSTYHYNKQTQKTLPVASMTAEKLLNNYMTVIKGRGTGSTGSSSVARNTIALRRRSEDQMHISEPNIKDYGDKVVINAFVFDAGEHNENERRGDANKREVKREQGKRRRAAAGGGRRGPGRRPQSSSPGGPERSGSSRPSFTARQNPTGPRSEAYGSGGRSSAPRRLPAASTQQSG